MEVGTKSKYEYFAFISYKREDEKWAKWLQKKLESYNLPTALRKENPKLPNKIRPIFRDQSDLSGGNLKTEIEKALNDSKYLIVICSPRSAKSPWVSKEVQYFIDRGREEFIIPFIIGGTPNATNPEEECFPAGLRELTGEKEILGININEMGRDAAAIKVVARMFGLRFHTLWQRHNREQNKRKWAIRIAALLLICFLITITLIINDKNNKLDGLNLELEGQKAALVVANDSILAEKERFQSVSVLQALALAESKIREGDFGYALSQLSLVKGNENLVRDANKVRNYNEVLRLLSDSMSNSHLSFVDILDSKTDSLRASKFLKISSIIKDDLTEDQKPVYFSYKRGITNFIDSIHPYTRVYNRDMSIMAVCDGMGDTDNDGDTEYSKGKNGIFIIANNSGNLIGFISSGGWYPSLFNPIAIDNTGTKLIYRTGLRENDYVRIHNFVTNRSHIIDKCETDNAYRQHDKNIDGAFNIDASKYALRYEEDGNSVIKIYSSGNNVELQKFTFPECQGMFWDDNDYLNVVCPTNTYIFDIKDKKNSIIELSLKTAVNNIAISPKNNDIAVLSSNGDIFIWDKMGTKLKYHRVLTGSKDKIEYCPLDNSLWITDGHDSVDVLDTETWKLINVSYESGEPSHRWTHDITFIDNGRTCVTYHDYPGSGYRKFDCLNRKIIEKDVDYHRERKPIFNPLVHRVDSLDMAWDGNHISQMSSVKISHDQKNIIRSYYSGKVILSDYNSYNRLINKLGILDFDR